ncbi:hypothetical protein AYO38_02345 [bacterium SCGC AG-212-C10]|nr:hypothetical protein AYO38_02345 [bacterium SCGC AG-212-C10]
MATSSSPDPGNIDFFAEMKPFLDSRGRLKQWPVKQRLQLIAIAYLATKFVPGMTYDERAVNDVLLDWHVWRLGVAAADAVRPRLPRSGRSGSGVFPGRAGVAAKAVDRLTGGR